MMIIRIKVLIIYILGLCIADSATTLAVIRSGIGYEANSAISSLASYPLFHIAKFIFTLVIIYSIHKMCKNDKKLEFVSYLALIMFYSTIVLNNVLVYTVKVGLGLDLPKMFILFGFVFSVVYLSVMSTDSHQIHIE